MPGTNLLSLVLRRLRGPAWRPLGSLILALGPWLSAQPLSGQNVTLAWRPSPDETVTGYRIHYGFMTGFYPMSVDAGPLTTGTIGLPVGGETYYLVATAYDTFGLESDYSNEVMHVAEGQAAEAIEQAITAAEDEPVALPWGSDAGYTSQARWLPAVPPGLGWLEDQDGRPVFVPLADAHGEDRLVYYVLDGATAYRVTARITIAAVNDAPMALELDIWTDEDAPVELKLPGSDADGDVLWAQITTPPLQGTLQGEGLARVYQPGRAFHGLDRFVYVVADAVTNSNAATAWIWVGAVDDRPAALDLNLRADEDTPLGLTLEGRDPGLRAVSFEITQPPLHGVLHGEGSQRVYQPAPDFHGPDVFRYVASNGFTNSEPASGQIVVEPVNDRPVARDLGVTTLEDTEVAVTLEAEDVDGDTLTFEVSSSPLHGTLHGQGAAWVYEPHPDFHGADAFRYLARDGVTSSEPASVQIVVEPVNDAPLARYATYRVVEGISRELLLEGSDAEGDSLDFRIAQAPVRGTLSGTPPLVRYEPESGFQGSDTFHYLVSDGMLDSAVGVVTIEVLPQADFETRLDVKAEGEQLRFSWQAVTGERYRLWHRSNLVQESWVPIAEVPPAEPGQETVTVLVPAVGGYYRCEVVVY